MRYVKRIKTRKHVMECYTLSSPQMNNGPFCFVVRKVRNEKQYIIHKGTCDIDTSERKRKRIYLERKKERKKERGQTNKERKKERWQTAKERKKERKGTN